MDRIVSPEILDSLPGGDPEAVRSRGELRLINAIMGNHRWLLRRVRALWQPGWRVLEIGAGDGGLGARLAGVIPPDALSAIDLAARPPRWPDAAQWRQDDIFSAPMPDAEIVVANLFLHHFEAGELARLGAGIPSTCRVFLCSEPARRRVHLWQGAVLAALARFGRVTRHDMPVSIRAGFAGEELPRLLGIGGWAFGVSMTVLGAYRCEAHRI